jgi:hypothetical protein
LSGLQDEYSELGFAGHGQASGKTINRQPAASAGDTHGSALVSNRQNFAPGKGVGAKNPATSDDSAGKNDFHAMENIDRPMKLATKRFHMTENLRQTLPRRKS